jgi:hypothetical protein
VCSVVSKQSEHPAYEDVQKIRGECGVCEVSVRWVVCSIVYLIMCSEVGGVQCGVCVYV